MLVGLDRDLIRNALGVLSEQKRGAERTLDIVSDYEAPNVSEKVARVILSYTHYINSFVWKK